MDNEFSRLTEIGKVFGVSSRVCGRWIADLGLRVVAGDPTPRAHELGLVKSAPIACGVGERPFFIWHRQRIVQLLEKKGHRQVEPEQQPTAASGNLLVGPFTSRINATNGYEILNSDGNVFCWVTGEEAATWVVRLLNLADEHGKFA